MFKKQLHPADRQEHPIQTYIAGVCQNTCYLLQICNIARLSDSFVLFINRHLVVRLLHHVRVAVLLYCSLFQIVQPYEKSCFHSQDDSQ